MASASLSYWKHDAVSVADLREHGFSEAEITHLTALKAAYPFIEYVDTANQWHRLLFLRWRFQHGDLQRSLS